MKKYTKNLADIIVLAEVAEYLYERAESFESQMEDYKSRIIKEEHIRHKVQSFNESRSLISQT